MAEQVLAAAIAVGMAFGALVLRYLFRWHETLTKDQARVMLTRLKPGEEETMLSIAAREYMAEGWTKGHSEGLSQGLSQGHRLTASRTLMSQLRQRFKTLPPEIEQQVATASDEQLDMWLDSIIEAPSLEALFAGRRH